MAVPVFSFGVLLVPLVLVIVGVVFVFRGIRGTPSLSDPKCARCGYDLRWIKQEVNTTCPECGADLRAKRAIRFGDFQRKPRTIVLGLAIIAVALLVPIVIRTMMFRSAVSVPGSASSMPTSALIARLATTANQPWDWQQLENRLKAGNLSKSDASAAIEQLITFLKSKPGGWNEPLHWSGSFVTAADKAGAISSEQFNRMVLAYYGPQPVVTIRKRIRKGELVRFDMTYGGPWNLSGLKLIRALSRVTVDGDQQLKVREPYSDREEARPDELSDAWGQAIQCKVAVDAAPGKHTLAFEVDLGLIDENRPLKTTNGKPGQVSKWPKTQHRWSANVKVPIEVVEESQPVVEVVTDDAQDPQKGNPLSASGTLYAGPEGKSVLRITFSRQQAETVPIAAKIALRSGVWRTDVSGIVVEPKYGSVGTETTISRPPSEAKSFDVILSPDVRQAEEKVGLERIWGKEIVLKDVSIVREDLEEPTAVHEGGVANKPSSRPASTPSR